MQVEYKENFEIKPLTTFKIGGKIKRVWFPKDTKEFSYILGELEDYIVLGNCSNVLISSEGYDGDIILTTQMKDFTINGCKITASCGVKGPALAQKTCDNSLSGFEFMIGFPGSVGGEICMNASAHGQSVSDSIVSCCLYDKEKKEIVCKSKDEMNFSYRNSILKSGKYVLLSAEFELKKKPAEEIKELIERNLEFRKSIQPNLSCPNAGSVFKNPPNDSAGRLLEKAGAKEFESDTVKVWDKHANFIINKGNATSQDVLEIMYKMYLAVKNAYTIELQPEIIFIGKKTEKEEEICKILYPKNQK